MMLKKKAILLKNLCRFEIIFPNAFIFLLVRKIIVVIVLYGCFVKHWQKEEIDIQKENVTNHETSSETKLEKSWVLGIFGAFKYVVIGKKWAIGKKDSCKTSFSTRKRILRLISIAQVVRGPQRLIIFFLFCILTYKVKMDLLSIETIGKH